MQGNLLVRLLALCAIFALAACRTANTTSGQTPGPQTTTLAQANSTGAPTQALSAGPGEKFIAKSGANHGVTFAVWANGTPVASIAWPNKAVDITKDMRGHANVLVIKWNKATKGSTGTLTIVRGVGATKVISADVTAKSPMSGSVSKTIIAPKVPTGTQSMNQ